MRSIISVASAVLFGAIISDMSAQTNLVYNPGFEIKSTCPTDFGQISLSQGWYACCNTPDYYNSCSIVTSVGVPKNIKGYQPAIEGSAYAGIRSFDAYSTREILGSELLQPMVIGAKYYLSMKIALADMLSESLPDTALFIPSNKTGFKFSTKKISSFGHCLQLVNNYAHLYVVDIIKDTAVWVTVQGSFIADSAYKYIMIGNFFSNSNTDTIGRPEIIYKYTGAAESYFFVDNVIVSTDSSIIQSVIPQRNKNATWLVVYPIPSTGKFVMDIHSGQNATCKLMVTDFLGKTVFEESGVSLNQGLNRKELALEKLPAGIYLVSLLIDDGCSLTEKIIIDK